MRIPIYQVDAFTDRPFDGNPAAVCPLDALAADERCWPSRPRRTSPRRHSSCPRATGTNCAGSRRPSRSRCADTRRWPPATSSFASSSRSATGVSFRTMKAGTLVVSRSGNMLAMDFPGRGQPRPSSRRPTCSRPWAARRARYCGPATISWSTAAPRRSRRLSTSDLAALAKVDCWAAIATAPGEDGIDFVSRFFAPAQGVPGDPVTGSSHCSLVPYWAGRLGKTKLQARQLSRRGGALSCALDGDRVSIAGRAVLYLEGQIEV